MFIFISDVLDRAALSSIRGQIAGLDFQSGARTAGWHAKDVKANRQAAPSALLRQVQRTIANAIENHDLVKAHAYPRRIAPPLISLYGAGEHYGPHVDDALMGSPPMRTDLSATLFLSDLEDYEGGELVIETAAGEDAIRLPAGSMVLYPSTCLHHVAPVTKGERLVAVTWIESLVPDHGQREILFDLARAKRSLYEESGKTSAFDLVAKSHANLLRRWARP